MKAHKSLKSGRTPMTVIAFKLSKEMIQVQQRDVDDAEGFSIARRCSTILMRLF